MDTAEKRRRRVLGGSLAVGLFLLLLPGLLDATGRQLAGNTLCLVLLTLAISLPSGTCLAVMLVRTDLPGRKFWLVLFVLQLFVPLYLHAAAWDTGFGVDGWFSTLMRTDVVWLEQLRGAVWVHAAAAIPWVVLIVGAGLRFVEPELEEDALLHASPVRVLLHVTLPRSLAAISVAAIWVTATTAGEMTATDLFRVRTFAEEVYASLAGGTGSAEAFTAVLPLVAMMVTLVLCGIALCARLTPPSRPESVRQSPVFSLGRLRRPLAVAIGIAMLFLTMVPLASLCYEAGVVRVKMDGLLTRVWSLDKFMTMVLGSPMRFADEFWWSFELGVLAATGAVIAALPLAWIARGGGRRAAPTLCITAVALALPGPLIATILIWLLNRRESALLVLLYDRTLLAPWLALLVRTVPWATLILWFAFRSLATDVLDSAASEGAGPLTRLFRIALPQRLAALGTAWLVTFAIALGDLSATVLVLPPGAETLSVRIFRLIHSAANDQVAGVCLALLGILVVLTAAAAGCVRRLR